MVRLLAFVGLAFVMAACGRVSDVEAPSTEAPASVEWFAAPVGYEAPDVVAPSGSVDPLVVRGSGADIWSDRDGFFFVYTELRGDGFVEARLDAFDAPHEWSKAGLMVRESLAPDARNVLLHTSRDNGAVLQAREVAGGVTNNDGGKDPSVAAGGWMRLSRSGDRVTGFLSSDRESWRELGSYTLDLGERVLVGLAVTSHLEGEEATATFTDVGVDLNGAAPDPVLTPNPQPDPDPDGTEPDPDGPAADAIVCGSAPLSPAYEPTYYVATDGDDGNDGRDASRPFRTLQRAADAVSAGDVVWVRGGVYSGTLTLQRSGTAEQPIVFESQPGECAIIDGSGRSSGQNVRLMDVRYNVFRNFVVRDSPAQGIYLGGASDNEITNVRTHDNVLSGIQNVSGSRNRFAWFISHDNHGGGDSDGIGLSSGDDNVIERCVTFRNSDDGIDTWRSFGSVVERCISFENGYNGGDGQGIKAGGGLRADTLVRYSVAFDNRTNGFDHNMSSGVVFEHNTAFGNGVYGFIAADSTLRNNLSFGNGRDQWQDNGGNSQASNSWNEGIGDPRVVSTDPFASDFLALTSGSPAIDAGTEIGLPYTGSAPDLGAVPHGESIASFLGIDLGFVFD